MKKQKEKSIKFKFLGTSSAEPIPRPGHSCPQCDSTDKKDKRLRSSLLVNKNILIDANPDIAKELRRDLIRNLEAVMITHEHEDAVGGLKDLLKIKRNLQIIKLKPGQHFKMFGIDFHAFRVKHSSQVVTVGIEIGPLDYISDVADLDWAMKYLKEAKIAVLDGSMLGRSFGGHLSINEIIAETKPLKNLKKIFFTHNGHTQKPHKEMEKLIQAFGDKRYHLAYDGLEIKV